MLHPIALGAAACSRSTKASLVSSGPAATDMGDGGGNGGSTEKPCLFDHRIHPCFHVCLYNSFSSMAGVMGRTRFLR